VAPAKGVFGGLPSSIRRESRQRSLRGPACEPARNSVIFESRCSPRHQRTLFSLLISLRQVSATHPLLFIRHRKTFRVGTKSARRFLPPHSEITENRKPVTFPYFQFSNPKTFSPIGVTWNFFGRRALRAFVLAFSTVSEDTTSAGNILMY